MSHPFKRAASLKIIAASVSLALSAAAAAQTPTPAPAPVPGQAPNGAAPAVAPGLGAPAALAPAPGAPKPFKEIIKDAKEIPGFFTLYQKDEKVWKVTLDDYSFNP